MEYEELLKIVGEIGPYQMMVFFVTAVFVLETPCYNMGMVFLGAMPDHYCKIPALESMNISEDVLKNATIPFEGSQYSKCQMYQRNYTNWTTQDVIEAAMSDKQSLQIIPCTDGWNYDDSIYKSTIVTQVSVVIFSL